MNKQIIFFIFILLSLIFNTGCTEMMTIKSPDNKVVVNVLKSQDGRLSYRLTRDGKAVLNDSPLGVTVDNADLGTGIELGEPAYSTINESYPWRGVKSIAHNHCNTMTIPILHIASDTNYSLEFKVFDDGAAFRYVIPAEGKHKINNETTSWNLPSKSDIWYQTNTINYEGVHEKGSINDLRAAIKMGMPVTVELPDGTYAAITEAALYDYSGMTLRTTGSTILKGIFEDDPRGFELEGDIKTPWRITMTGPGLNDLVNCDIVHNVSPPPDKKLFPNGMNTEWIKPGRALWHWWSTDTPYYDEQKFWIDSAAKMGFEYYLVDEGWENWEKPDKDKWDHLKELCDYAKSRGIGIFVWRCWADNPKLKRPGIETPEKRNAFFEKMNEVGVVGVKIDFMDSESKDRIDFYTNTLIDAAKHKLMVNFHGANKPAGEPRTFPNEVSREGIKGLEHNKWSALPPDHYASLPFTRLIAGHGDFTPCTFNPDYLKGTTLCCQLAAAVLFTSPALHWADRPELYFKSKAYKVMTQIPSVWDETIVLPKSEIGDLAAMARRTGDKWFVGIINGGDKKTYTLKLDFLDDVEYEAHLLSDVIGTPADMNKETKTVTNKKRLTIELDQGGGFVGYLMKK